MKKTLALALVLVMVISSVCVLFASAEDVASVNVEFTQEAGASTKGGSVTLFKADADKERVIDSDTANLRWAYVIVADKDGKITALASQLLNTTDDPTGKFSPHFATVPAGGFAVVSHHGNDSELHPELLQFIYDLAKAAGLSEDGKNVGAGANTQSDVSSAGWTAVLADDEKSVTLYKGAAPSTEEPSEDTSSAEPVEVKEEIKVDGKLDDNGWTRVAAENWVSETYWQQPDAPELADVTAKFTTRTDDENVYVGVEIDNIPAPSINADYDPDMTPNEAGTQITGYGQTSTSMLRVWIRVKDDLRYAIDIQYLGEEKGWAVVRLIYSDAEVSAKLSDFTSDNYAFNYADNKLTAEVSFKKAMFLVTGDYRLYVTYSSNFEPTEDRKASYQALHIANADVEKGENGYITKYSGEADVGPYVTFNADDVKLGTYTEESQEPAKDPAEELKKELADKVTPVENADFKVDLTSKLEKNDAGKLVYTVTLKVKDIKEGVHMQSFTAALHYDPEVLKLTTEVNPNNSLKCEVKVPGSTWENLVKVEPDVDGKPTGIISVEYTCTEPPFDEVSADNFELCFTFEVLTDAKAVGVYVDSEDAKSTYMPNDADNSDITNYKGEGSYTVDSYAEPVEESSSSSEASSSTTTTPSKPGDAGILIFAVLGIVAIAGAVTVIKVRR